MNVTKTCIANGVLWVQQQHFSGAQVTIKMIPWDGDGTCGVFWHARRLATESQCSPEEQLKYDVDSCPLASISDFVGSVRRISHAYICDSVFTDILRRRSPIWLIVHY